VDQHSTVAQETAAQDAAARGRHDVAILGSGIAGATLALILARHGVSVVMVDEGTHPRFTIGEMGVHSSALFRVLADRYDVPELKKLSGFKEISSGVTRAIGAERCHGFVYHRAGQPPDPAEVVQVSPPKGAPPEPNLYRQDIDAFVFYRAVARGAAARQQAKIASVDVGAGGVAVTTARGEVFRARYLVDASGCQSPFVRQMGLREEPTRLKLRSRSLYTHMVNVRTFDEVAQPSTAYRAPAKWGGGSLHHLFDGGYLWIIPFGNHPDTRNLATSVGLTLDEDRFPRQGAPEEEFRAVLDRFPWIGRQLEAAEPVQPWAATGRQQYSSTRTVGDRWCVIGDAAGHVDPFLSRSLVNGLEAVNVLAWRLLEAVREDDFAAERFEFVDRFGRQLLDGNDDLASMFLASLADHPLSKAVLYVLEVGFRYGGFPLLAAYSALRSTGSDAALRELENAKYPGGIFPTHEGYNQMFQAAVAECAAVRAGADPAAAAERIFAMVREADFVPAAFALDDPSRRFLRITPITVARLAAWSLRGAPPDIAPLIRTAIRSLVRQ
jgi:tetracycline 7-halogenase / FADH2 O2-dependent halogenase